MFAEYIQAALERAEYEIIDDFEPYYAHVPCLPGVWATGKTFEDCRKHLISVIEGWIVLGLRMGHPIPSIDGHTIDVSRSGCPSMRLPQTERLTITTTHLDVSPRCL
jgi:predicted RNase H-like HicB family nuclease